MSWASPYRGLNDLIETYFFFYTPVYCWIRVTMTAVVDREKCTACETCVDECPAAAIAMNDGKAKVDKDLCVDCGSCVDVCPSEAIHLE